MNNAAVNTGAPVSSQLIVLSGYMPRSGIAQSYGNSSFNFLRSFCIVSIMTAPIYIPIRVEEGSLYFQSIVLSMYP